MARRYTDEQRAWLTEHYPLMTNAELLAAWPWHDTTPVTPESMRSYGSNHHLRKVDRWKWQNEHRKYSDEQLAWMRAFIPGHHENEIIGAYEREFGERLTVNMVANLKVKLGVRSHTLGGQFECGHEPANKGRPITEWMPPESRERSSKSWFKKGSLNGIASTKARPLLDVRETKDGYLQIKVAPRKTKNSMHNWISLAQFVWMQANGREWPENHVAVFADKDNRNFDPENIVPVPRRIYAIVTGGSRGRSLPYHDRESLELAMLHARVRVKRGELERRSKRKKVDA